MSTPKRRRAAPPTLSGRFVLGSWAVAPSLGQIDGPAGSRRLEPRAMRVLSALASANGAVVSLDELMDAAWNDVVVTPSSLYEAVAQLRRVLGRDDDGRDYIVTVPRRGYRLREPVKHVARPAAMPRLSIAVRAFRAQQVPPSHAFLPYRLTEDLIGELSRNPELFVVSRGTMLALADSELPSAELGHQLKVRFVVEGRIERGGAGWRIDAHVIDAETGAQTWADAVTMALDAWPEAGALVVGRLARALDFELRDATARVAPIDVSGAPSPRALDARVLATRAWVELFTRPENRVSNEAAAEWARQSLALDSGQALASVCLATADWRAAQFGWSDLDRPTLLARALAHAEAALSLGPRDPDAPYVLSLIAYSRGETVRAEEALRHCIALSASFAPAYGLLALIRTRRGHPDEAAAWCEQAFALSPREPLRAVWHLALAWSALASGDFSDALAASQRSMSVNPDFATCYVTGVAAAHGCSAPDLAASWIAHLRERTVFKTVRDTLNRLPPATEAAHRRQMADLAGWLSAAGLPED